jgi:hypothetical protein
MKAVTLKPSSSPIKQWGLDALVFFTLIQETEISNTGKVFSIYNESELSRKLRHIPLLEIRKSLSNLSEQGYLEQQGIRIQIGEDEELYSNLNEVSEPFPHEDKIAGSLRKLQSARIRGVDSSIYYNQFKKLCALDKLNVVQFLSMYRCMYFSELQELPTEFSAKEKGQMGHLVKFYGTGNRLKNLIYEYIVNSEKYSKGYISIGGLLYARYKVEANLAKKAPKKIVRGVTDEF